MAKQRTSALDMSELSKDAKLRLIEIRIESKYKQQLFVLFRCKHTLKFFSVSEQHFSQSINWR